MMDSLARTTAVAVGIRTNELDDTRSRIYNATPDFMQTFFDWLTANPMHPPAANRRTEKFYLTVAALQTFGGIAMGWTGMYFGGGILELSVVVLGLLCTTAGLGLSQVCIMHYCAHRTFFRNRSTNGRVGSLVASILFLGDFERYVKKHHQHHCRRLMFTAEDEFVEFVVNSCRLDPGLPKVILWRRTIICTLSLYFHTKFLLSRVYKSNSRLKSGPCLTSIALWSVTLIAVNTLHQWSEFLVTVVLPFTVLFQISVLLRTLCEHIVPEAGVLDSRDKEFPQHATRGVFAGVAPPRCAPDTVYGIMRWTAWWINMLTVQLAFRVVILVGDACCHDLHHRQPGSRTWVDYMSVRRAETLARAAAGAPPYRDVWGPLATFDTCLESITRWGSKPKHAELSESAIFSGVRQDSVIGAKPRAG